MGERKNNEIKQMRKRKRSEKIKKYDRGRLGAVCV
jgi:hypothetical protein